MTTGAPERPLQVPVAKRNSRQQTRFRPSIFAAAQPAAGALQEQVQHQGLMLQQLQARLGMLQRAQLDLTLELAELARSRGGSGYFIRGGRGVMLSPPQHEAIAALKARLARGEYRMAPHPCPCGAHADQLLAVRDRYGIAVNTVICRVCGLMRIDPYYTPETLTGFYSQEYGAIYGRGLVDFSAHFARSYQMRGAPVVRNLRQRRVALEGRRVYEIGCWGCFYGFVKHLSGLTSTFLSPPGRGPASTDCCQILTPCPLKGEGLVKGRGPGGELCAELG